MDRFEEIENKFGKPGADFASDYHSRFGSFPTDEEIAGKFNPTQARRMLESKVRELIQACENEIESVKRKLAAAKRMKELLKDGVMACELPPLNTDFRSNQLKEISAEVDLLVNMETDREMGKT